jgi:hypothetical protein
MNFVAHIQTIPLPLQEMPLSYLQFSICTIKMPHLVKVNPIILASAYFAPILNLAFVQVLACLSAGIPPEIKLFMEIMY